MKKITSLCLILVLMLTGCCKLNEEPASFEDLFSEMVVGTELQQEELEGKTYTFEFNINNVKDSWLSGGLSLHGNNILTGFSPISNIHVKLQKDQKNKAMNLKKGEKVKVIANFQDKTSFSGYWFECGKIIE